MTPLAIKKLYNRYFQKSRAFLFPVLGLKKITKYPFVQSYLQMQDKYVTDDYKLIAVYNQHEDSGWNHYLLHTIMANPMFEEIIYLENGQVAIVFSLRYLKDDYELFLAGKYSKLSKTTRTLIREFYGYNSPEWAYMESFLYPEKYIGLYSKLLDVDSVHIRHTGQLCDLPDLEQETLKIKAHAKLNAHDRVILEQWKNI